MSSLPTFHNLEEATEFARVVVRQLERYEKKVRQLTIENAKLRKETPEDLQKRLELLEEQVAAADGAGKSMSERRRQRRRERNGSKKKRPKDSHGNTPQLQLPHEELLAELPEEQQVCAKCGEPLQKMQGQTEDSEVIVSVERKYAVKTVKRQKYRPSCKCGGCTIVAASKPDEVASLGGRYGLSVVTQVATDKFVDHQPLNRQVARMAQQGLIVTTQTLAHQLWLLARAVEGTYNAIKADLLSAPLVHIDETSWRSLNDRDGVHMLWGMVSARGAYYAIQDNRAHGGVLAMLGDYQGLVQSDGLSIYKKASKEYGYKLVGCWAHARRKFFKAEADFAAATPILDKMDELFRIERELKDAGASNAEILARRQRDSQPIVDDIRELLYETTRKHGVVKTTLRDALQYLSNQWTHLTVFLTTPEAELSNNAAEKVLRPPVLGRKNYGGTRSRKGELTSAMLFTMVETARIRGINPGHYLEAIARRYLKVRRTYPRGPLSDEDHRNLLARAVLLPDRYLADHPPDG